MKIDHQFFKSELLAFLGAPQSAGAGGPELREFPWEFSQRLLCKKTCVDAESKGRSKKAFWEAAT